ncbi:transferrin receptor-like dimerization domain-containing protein [Flavitalea sp. BT771]|uniref:transferrin receptor-like dimerization domain-containing protein n=1 Tax=Flavitalea sp. BT771 TaxID=3063329 RepID=UPI0026E1C8D8|nr:transferrin receptor-like dimerization domain-containing protein [Flavitalea sp. BT771]MDO6433398.1 transferrin receptor-like dimerization domain-containing protein [Flavitalea sp. BT771]MDV6222697.1 transferrin receptor-like dimerization domain-containing protein [Flavitalea sp. BT771]
MRKYVLTAGTLLLASLTWSQTKPLAGFSESAAKEEFAKEEQFDGYLKASNVDSFMKVMSAHPHHVGSPAGKAVADFIYGKFKGWGYDVQVETFYVLFPTPKERLLEMTGPTSYKAVLAELALKEDATSGQSREQLPTYNCWSPDGDVTGQLVFVNYGIPEDYDLLERLGISVKGKIVIAKYGHSWRGIKPKVAQEHGAIGCLIYSDPKDDGYYEGDVYPKGAFKNEYGVQRGSVMDMPVYPGDPLTPGIGATKDAKRLDRKDVATILKIPVLPISYHDAAPLLKALEGPVAPESWRGALPFTYHVGPGKATVHLKLAFNWDIKPINNVIARLPGSQWPDEWVIRGNHHDGWVNGAGDPLSGMSAMLEEARGVSELVKTGWKPKRTMIYCAWDGEEPGLLGSTEWVEYHADELRQKAVVYINTDGSGRGFFGAEGSHALEPFMNEVARDVTDPETGISIGDRMHSRELVNAAGGNRLKKDLFSKKTFSIGALGSGSDFSPFLQHTGIPSFNLAFGGEDPGGEYHSIYDSYDDYRRFKDPGFQYGVALAKAAGRTSLRMADASLLPFDFRSLYKTVSGYATELSGLLDQMRESTALSNQLIREHHYSYAGDPTVTLLPPPVKEEVPYLDFSPLQNALRNLEKATDQLADTLGKRNLTNLAANVSDAVNQALYKAEQQLLSDKGLPRRDWYRHAIYAPGFYTGYGVKTLPGIREAIEQRNWKEAQEQIGVAASVLQHFTDYLNGIRF